MTPTGPGVVIWAGMIPTLDWPGEISPGQFGPRSPRSPVPHHREGAGHVLDGNTLRDRHDEGNAGVRRFHDGTGPRTGVARR